MLKTVSSITNAIGALNYKGAWNASTNTPTIVSSVGVKGDYYVVSVNGTTAIDGISNWGVGDWITFNGSTWQRVEGGADLNGVNIDYTGTLTGGTGVINIGSGQVYKDASGNVGIGTSSPLEQLHLLENYLARTAGRAGLVNRGVKYIVQSAGTSATNICRFNVGYENTAGRATAALIDITIMYATHDSNSRAAVSVANLRASVVRGDRAGNQFGTSTNLQLIGNAVLSDTGGSTFRLIDISNFSSSLTGGASAAQQVTIEFTPPSPLASGGSVVAIAEIVNLSSANGPLVTLVKL